MKWLRTIVPFAISAVLIIIIIGLAPWPEVWESLKALKIWTLVLLITLSLLYYGSKVIRFWYMLKYLNLKQPLGIVALVYLSAQPLSLLPAGEVFRSRAFRVYRDIPMSKTMPTFTAQGIYEGLAMAFLGLLCAVVIGIGLIPTAILTVLAVAAIAGIRLGYLANFLRAANAIPFVNLSRERLQNFSQRNQDLMRGRQLLVLGALSLAAEIVGLLIAYVSVIGIGANISLLEAGLAYVVPVIVSFVSFLPGGLGAGEQSSIGILLLFGLGAGAAVAATLVMRLFIVGSGLIYGAIGWAILRLPALERLNKSA